MAQLTVSPWASLFGPQNGKGAAPWAFSAPQRMKIRGGDLVMLSEKKHPLTLFFICVHSLRRSALYFFGGKNMSCVINGKNSSTESRQYFHQTLIT